LSTLEDLVRANAAGIAASGDDAGERSQYHGFIQYRDDQVVAADIYVRGSDGRD
jgi:hypothetical protein